MSLSKIMRKQSVNLQKERMIVNGFFNDDCITFQFINKLMPILLNKFWTSLLLFIETIIKNTIQIVRQGKHSSLNFPPCLYNALIAQ